MLGPRIALATAFMSADKLLVSVDLACTLALFRSSRVDGVLNWIVLQLSHGCYNARHFVVVRPFYIGTGAGHKRQGNLGDDGRYEHQI